MAGIALRLLEEKGGVFRKQTIQKWPELWEFVLQGKLSKIDYFLAAQIAKTFPSFSLNSACFLISLVAASRQGHLCLKIEDNAFFPPLADCFSDEEAALFIETKAKEGIDCLPKEILDEPKALSEAEGKLICRWKNAYYLQSSWLYENRFVNELRRIAQFRKHSHPIPELSSSLQAEQRKSIELALEHPITLITGGPGTGKTFTAAHLIKAFLDSQGSGKIIALAAPTGKAAANLEMALQKTGIERDVNIIAGTLHSLIGFRSANNFFEDPQILSCDLLIVDECSMIDARLFGALLSAVGEKTKVVLMGDSDQLSAVESGSYFADLVQASRKGYPLPCAELKKSMRSDKAEILQLAAAINEGNVEEVMKLLNANERSVKRAHLGISSLSIEQFYEKLWRYAQDLFPKPSHSKIEPEELLRQWDAFRILTPLRKGPFGVDAINSMLNQNFLREVKRGEFWASPILITKTSYDLDLCNGDAGILFRYLGDKKLSMRNFNEQDTAFFWDKKEGSFRTLAAVLLPAFEYAYCLSVHKSQGSEYKRVLLLASEGTEHFGREVLYTAITRAKETLEIEADDNVLRKALQKGSRKISGLLNKLLNDKDEQCD